MVNAVAFFGDVHGHHDEMVRSARNWQERTGVRVNLIICAGDFQALRDETDMRSMACPAKYRQMGDYAAYYRGDKVFPAEILFIGGNHEAYNRLDEMPQGGTVGPRCYFFGRQGVISRFGLRIAGLTGIYSPKAYEHDRSIVDFTNPLVIESQKLKKQATYFLRQEVEALARSGPVDVLVVHDWAAGLAALAAPGTMDGTPRQGVGNKPARMLLEVLKPRWLFCGHLHWYFRGDIVWPEGEITTFVCLDKVVSSKGPYMCVLQGEDNGEWHLQVEGLANGPQAKF